VLKRLFGKPRSVPAAVESPPAIRFPRGFDSDYYFGKLNSAALEYSDAYRRDICRTDPMMFGICYMSRHLISPETGPDINISQFHLDIAEAAVRWMRNDLGPSELREAWIVARGGAKSTWTFTILACWALAFGHRRFIASFGANNNAVTRHFATLREEFATNELLRADFPDLCEPAKVGGKARSDNANAYIARSGAVMMAHGIDSTQLGAKVGNIRPDLILFDDCESDEGNYSPYQKDRRLSTMTNGVLAMNPNAVVQLCGTVTMYGSITHDLVRWALNERDTANQWVGEQNIRPRYYAPIVTDDAGNESSFWEARYSLEYLRSIRGTTYYELNFLNLPRSTKDGLWQPSDIVVNERMTTTDRVMRIDPSVSTKDTSDQTGIGVAGLGPMGNVLIEYAIGVRPEPDELRDLVGRITWNNRNIHEVHLETNQGGNVMVATIRPVLPPGVKLVEVWTGESKDARFWRFFDFHKLGWVYYAETFPELRKQMLGYPKTRLDDILDAVSGAADHFLKGRPRPMMR